MDKTHYFVLPSSLGTRMSSEALGFRLCHPVYHQDDPWNPLLYLYIHPLGSLQVRDWMGVVTTCFKSTKRLPVKIIMQTIKAIFNCKPLDFNCDGCHNLSVLRPRGGGEGSPDFVAGGGSPVPKCDTTVQCPRSDDMTK